MRRILILLLPALLTAACSSMEPTDDVRVRVENTSVVDFDRVVINFPAVDMDYGAVAAGESTGYEAIGQSYRYARVTATVGGNDYTLQPVDYVGERLLPNGRYTYRVSFDPVSLHLGAELVRD
ncbi:MAG TPA: hypothetical protein VFZ24_04180 [Longimicrobiales bacterium]